MMNNIRKGEFLDISPKNDPPLIFSHNDKENAVSVAVLSLVHFSRAPYVSFGTVRLGTSRSEVLCIENPVDNATEIKVDKVASTKGFSVDRTQFIIPAEGSTHLMVNWTPVEEGNVRELITFIANGITKHQAILLGRAEAPKKKKKSLWDSIKRRKAAHVSVPFRENKTHSSLKKTANKTFHVSRQPQYKTERVQSPLRSCNEEPLIQERVSVLTGSIENVQEQLLLANNYSPVPFEKTHVTLTQTGFESIVSSCENSPVVLLVPTAELFDERDVTKRPCAAGATCITDDTNMTGVLNTTHFPVCTPKHGDSRPITRIHSHQSPISCEGKIVSSTAKKILPALSVRDALSIIQSDLTESDGESPPNACSSFDFSDSLESVKENDDQNPVTPEVTERRVQDISFELETLKPRLTFFVKPKSDQVNGSESEVNDVVPLNFRKFPFSPSTVTKSRVCPTGERSRTTRKMGTSKRQLLEKTLELSEDSPAKSSLLGQKHVCLPVIDSDASHDIYHSAHSPLEAVPSDHSPVRWATTDYFPVSFPPRLAQLDMSSVIATPSCGSQTSVKSDLKVLLNVQHQSTVTFLMPQPNETPVDVPALSLSCGKKRKSDEFLSDKMEKGKPLQVKRSRVFPAAKETKKPIQDRKFSSRSTSQSLHRKAVATKAVKSVGEARTKLPISKSVQKSMKSFGSSSLKTARNVAVAQAKLTFIKPAQSVIPRHPLPFAAKNMFYDERWIEKQERGFVWWINYVLTPDDFKVSTEVTKVSAVSLAMGSDNNVMCPKAPTKEEMSFKMYTARRRLNSLRRAACQLFTSEAMVKAIQRLELEVEAKRLLVRKDRHLWKDIGERQKILTWLLSYNPLWLRIGLETIFGELIPLENNSDVMGLAVFILNRLLWNPDIAAEFRHPTVPHLYRDGHKEALSCFTLKKLLLLVCFLDKAKESRLIEHDPCLFCMDAEFKTSKDLLLAFSRDFLSGEGILSRHLGHLGLPVSHAQVPLDEFNFAVKNLASDLRCGIRLVRVMELFTQDWSLSCKLRMPAVSRLQKVHNVELALEVLKAKGVDLKDEYACAIDARDIVDGHREKTLTLLWKIIFAFQVDVLLDDEQLKEEISFLKRTWRTRQKLETLRANLDVADKPNEERPPFQHSSTKIKLLMDWVNAVSAFYDSNVENFTVSFSDGQILCFLIHHYHPSHLPLESVCRRTTQTVDCGQEGRLGLNCSSSDSDSSFDIRPRHQTNTEASVNFAELLENEKSNFQLVNKAVAYLGGVPAMVHTADMSNTIPNEKVVMCYLSFLCARLLDLRKETRSARIIQGAWRKYRLRIELRRYKEANAAATTIQSVIKKFLQRRRRERLNAAAIVIQTVWRSYSACLELRRLRMEKLKTLQDSAATAIQAQWRKHLAMRKFQKLKHCTVMMQARLRMIIAVTAYRRILWAARTIQEHRCAVQLAKEERERYLSLRCSVITIQRSYRKWKARTWVKKTYAATVIQRAFQKWQERKLAQQTVAAIKIQHSSAIVIQRAFRAHILRRRFTEMRQAANVIQRWFRAWRQKENEMQQYLEMKRVTITLQAAFRGYLVRKAIKKQWRASVVIQTAFRMFVARKRFLSLKKATLAVQQQYKAVLLGQKLRKEYLDRRSTVVILQALWRGRAERRKIEKMCKAAVLIQSYYRSYAARSDLRLKRNAVLTIQSYYRAHRLGRMTRLRYLLLRKAAISLQAGFHGMKVRQELKKQHRAATLIQATFRAFTCRQQFLSLRSAATVLQKRYRAHLLSLSHQRHYSLLRQMTIRIQAVYRGSRERRNIRSMHKAATTIQRRFRTSRDRKRFISLRAGAVLVQQRYRALIAMRTQRKEYLVKCWSAINLQAAYRGMKVRQHLKQMQAAACVIQRRFRTNTARRQYLSLKSSVLTIQRRYRCVTAARRQREHYHCVRSATITLQAAYRGQKTRKEMQQKHAAATVLQAEFRMHRAVVTFQAMRLAAVIIQRHYKACKQMKQDHEKFLTIRNSAITIQAAFRGQRARQNMVQQHRAAIIIQSNYRMHRQQVAFQRMHWAATVLQQKFRALKLRDSQVLLYQQIKKATVCIQTLFRYKRAREQEKQKKAAVKVQSFMRMCVQRRRFLQQKAASIVIQSAFRCHHARVRYTKMQTSSMQIQRWYKSCRLAQKQKVEYLAVRRATVTLQSAFRGMLARRLFAQHQAAVKIQSVLKMFRYRKRFLNLRSSAVKIQVHYRMWAARRLFRCYRTAALTLQKNFRAWQEMKDQRCVYLNTRKSALTLQAAVRGHIEYKKFQRIKRSAVTIQAAFRGHRARLHAKKVQAALKIQAWFRGNLVRQKFIAKQKAIATVRRCMQTRLHRNRFQKIRQSVCVIQRRWRETLDAKRAHKNFLKMRYSAVKIQALWRGRRIRLNQQKEWKAACMIQSSYRGYMQRKAFAHMKKSVLVLQRRFRALQRGKEGLETFENMKTAVTTLQAFCRGWHARRLLKEEAQSRRICRFSAAVYVNLCAIKIQRGLRAHWALKSAKRQLHYVIYIQRWIRAKLQKKRYLDKKLKIIKVQRAVRGWYSWRNRAATIIQHAVRKYLSKKRDQRVQLGIIKAQALWRGHRSREANDSPKVVAMRHRLRKINQTVKAEDRLCNKTTVAIDYLLRYKHFSYILAALKHLETATRLSPECCELLVNSGATLIIFTLIRSCNRSIPCMEVITFAIQVLLNLSKYYKTTDAVYAVENSVNTLLDLLQIYREKAGDKVADKGGSIFTKTCFLLIILLQDEQRALEVRNLPKATDRIRSLYFLTARKHKMDTESSVKKLKINASLNGSFFPQRTPRKEKPQRRIAPDWALRQDNMKELVDPLQAIQMVAEAFTVLP